MIVLPMTLSPSSAPSPSKAGALVAADSGSPAILGREPAPVAGPTLGDATSASEGSAGSAYRRSVERCTASVIAALARRVKFCSKLSTLSDEGMGVRGLGRCAGGEVWRAWPAEAGAWAGEAAEVEASAGDVAAGAAATEGSVVALRLPLMSPAKPTPSADRDEGMGAPPPPPPPAPPPPPPPPPPPLRIQHQGHTLAPFSAARRGRFDASRQGVMQ